MMAWWLSRPILIRLACVIFVLMLTTFVVDYKSSRGLYLPYGRAKEAKESNHSSSHEVLLKLSGIQQQQAAILKSLEAFAVGKEVQGATQKLTSTSMSGASMAGATQGTGQDAAISSAGLTQGGTSLSLKSGSDPMVTPARGRYSVAVTRAREALQAHDKPTEIPKIIHQMFGLYSTTPGIPQYARDSINSFRNKNPGYTHILWNATDLDIFMETFYPAFLPVYRRFRIPVLKADLARYLVVATFGGTYSDIDTICLKPISQWADGRSGISVIIGVEADAKDIPNWQRAYGRQLQICQWTFASSPGHPIMSLTAHRIMDLLVKTDASAVKINQVTHTTGPTVFTDAFYDYVAMHGRKWQEFLGMPSAQQIGDLLLLRITGFSPNVGHMGSKPSSHPEAKVEHRFKGSWTRQGDAGRLLKLL